MTELTRIVALGVAGLIAQDVRHFDYDANAPLGLTEIGVEHRAAADVHDVTYASPKGGRVPAYLVVPTRLQPERQQFAEVIWGHWYWENSPQRNRTEFLDEAAAL